MKSLQESLLDDEDILMDKTKAQKIFYKKIEQFLKDTYEFGFSSYKIYEKNNKFFVDITGQFITISPNASILNNGMFKWGKVDVQFFNIYGSPNLKTLEGAPEEFKGNFICTNCYNLVSLKGAPKKMEGYFDCSGCNRLKTLEGAPEECYHFTCNSCNSLKNLKGAPKIVNGNFNCTQCNDLVSLEGSPKIVKGNYNCYMCGKQFTKEEVRKYSNVKRIINI